MYLSYLGPDPVSSCENLGIHSTDQNYDQPGRWSTVGTQLNPIQETKLLIFQENFVNLKLVLRIWKRKGSFYSPEL